MSAGYRAIQWNREKRIYDAIVLGAVAVFIGGFTAIEVALAPPADARAWIDLRIRTFGLCAFLLLTTILAIGPLARLDRRFLPVLYNRRHLGVVTFLVAACHGAFVVEWFAAGSELPNLAAELTRWADYRRFVGFPYKTLGIVALAVMLVMAATSHDYWLAFLTPPVWKALHMAVYVAYGLVVMHVALGALQHSGQVPLAIVVVVAFGVVCGLHVAAGRAELSVDAGTALTADGWIVVGKAGDIPDGRARIVAAPGGERIAVFRHVDLIGALSNLCAHQNGPIGEGCIRNGLVTCPWHGFEYRLEDGRAPPPFTEVLATYRLRIVDGLVQVDPRPQPPGTPTAITLPG
ncbi:MAG: ferric reductase-like transmembrane domain-containing protein [Alphaproteobacteria bacterium]